MVLWRRGSVVPCSAVSHVTQSLKLQSISSVLHVHCQCILDAFFFRCVVYRGSLCQFWAISDPSLAAVHFNGVVLVCLWNETSYWRHWNWGSGLGDTVLAGYELVFCGRGHTASGLKKAWLEWLGRANPLSMGVVWGGAWFGVSKLSSECRCSTSFHSDCVFILRSQERKLCLLAPLFLEVSPWDLCLSGQAKMSK